MHKHRPIFFVFAGNNGSGKSTIRNLIIDKIGVDINIDANAIARRLNLEDPATKRITAGKEIIKSVNQYLNEGKDFSIETTLAGNNALKQIAKAKEYGYEVTMFYVALNNVRKNIERVAMRVENGGHHISTEDILRRDETSFKHLYEYAPIIDNIVLIDNSKDGGEIILEINDGKITFEVTPLPQWVLPLYQQFQKNPPTEP
ncbi:zeta toxin family protein [Barrientosiimonas marina]|uniref:UDP-N-acetylglucosamine kinase n=1 Tax=Lentibacillus kimchii TaxID=1542911 RepID=A0ABW2UY50_9BACI